MLKEIVSFSFRPVLNYDVPVSIFRNIDRNFLSISNVSINSKRETMKIKLMIFQTRLINQDFFTLT